MKLAILLAVLGLVAVQTAEAWSLRSSNRLYRGNSGKVAAALARAQALRKLWVASATEDFCSQDRDCDDDDSECEIIDHFLQTVCNEGGLFHYAVRRIYGWSKVTEVECAVASLIGRSRGGCDYVCQYLQGLLESRCPEPEDEEQVDPANARVPNSPADALTTPPPTLPPSTVTTTTVPPSTATTTTVPPTTATTTTVPPTTATTTTVPPTTATTTTVPPTTATTTTVPPTTATTTTVPPSTATTTTVPPVTTATLPPMTTAAPFPFK